MTAVRDALVALVHDVRPASIYDSLGDRGKGCFACGTRWALGAAEVHTGECSLVAARDALDAAHTRDEEYLAALARAHLLADEGSREETVLAKLLENACAVTSADLDAVQERASNDLRAGGLL